MVSGRFRRVVPVAAVALITAACGQLANLPTLKPSDLAFKLPQTSAIYAADGTLITTLHGEQNRTNVPLAEMPEHLREAVIAIEDERFYEHEGVDVKAIIRAVWSNATSGEIREGGSTITQQYVKNVIIAPGETAEKTLERKIDEAALSRQLEQELSKNKILERYLNTVYFGNGAYGVEAAAQTYFSTPARILSLTQSATIAGLIRSPETYSPLKYPEAAIERRNVVLTKMEEQGYLTHEETLEARGRRLKLDPLKNKERYAAPYFVDYVHRLVTYHPDFDVVGKTVAERTRRLFQGGLKIYTTVDLEMQKAAEDAWKQVLTYPTDPYASLVALEPQTGYVRAMVGGRDWFAPRRKDPFAKLNLAIPAEPGLGHVKVAGTKNEFENKAPGTGRQSGSAFKTFALAAALESGISLSKVYQASGSMTFPFADGGNPWTVQNYDGSAFGSISLLEATVRSVNVVFAQVILEVGAQAVVDLAHDMGINTELAPLPSAVLGANAVNALGMASGYATLARGGIARPPVAITKIVDTTKAPDKVIYSAPRGDGDRVLSASSAYLATTALQSVVSRGTAARYAPIVARPAAGKTGTAQEWRDAWFVGYTPDLVAAVWVGYPEASIEMKTSCYTTTLCRPTRITVTGGSWPTQIWAAFMLRALANTPASSFEIPELQYVTLVIDVRTGCLADELTPPEFQSEETFTVGSEPTESSTACFEKGPKIRIPDLFGFTFEEAARILQGAGLSVVRVDEPSSTYPPGRVIGQDPGPGTKAFQGGTVTLIVSVEGEEEVGYVPNVLGFSREEAEAALARDGFAVRVIIESETNEEQAEARAGLVWKQQPSGGAELERGGTVSIWVNPD